MGKGEIQARHYATQQPVRLRWEEGRILELAPISDPTGIDQWLAPGLVDLQINGFSGVDFQQDNLQAADLLKGVRGLRNTGCTRFLLTLMTDAWPRLIARLEHLRALRAQSVELREAIAGWHIEGPFLSDQPGYSGAHDPTRMCDPTPQLLHELRRAAGSDPVLLTLAPERKGAIAAIGLAVSLGFKVSVGHSNASHACLLEAIDAGARAFTHLGNGCPAEWNRHDNILWRVFEAPGLTVSLIPDGIHVSPPLFRLIHRVLKNDAIYYTTDAMAAADAPPGRYTIGPLMVEVGPDQVVHKPASALFAGSALTPIQAVLRASHMLDDCWRHAWARMADIPARLMGWPDWLQPGAPADFCLVHAPPHEPIQSVEVIAHGQRGTHLQLTPPKP